MFEHPHGLNSFVPSRLKLWNVFPNLFQITSRMRSGQKVWLNWRLKSSKHHYLAPTNLQTQWLEHWSSIPKVLGSVPGWPVIVTCLGSDLWLKKKWFCKNDETNFIKFCNLYLMPTSFIHIAFQALPQTSLSTHHNKITGETFWADCIHRLKQTQRFKQRLNFIIFARI